MNPINVIFAWSGGKDSAYALWKLKQDPKFNVVALMTTYNKELQRVSMHGNKIELTRLQAKQIGLPLIEMMVSESTNAEYEKKMAIVLEEYKSKHAIKGVVFGDIFLEDLRAYRERNLEKVKLKAFFPLWKEDTTRLAHSFIENGFKTTIRCASDGYFNKHTVGKQFNLEFLKQLPKSVDPCGENGEFHTFCYDGPIFENPINISLKVKVYKPLDIKYWTEENPTRGYWYIELETN